MYIFFAAKRRIRRIILLKHPPLNATQMKLCFSYSNIPLLQYTKNLKESNNREISKIEVERGYNYEKNKYHFIHNISHYMTH